MRHIKEVSKTMSIRHLALLSCLVPVSLIVAAGCAGSNDDNTRNSPFPARSLVYHERIADDLDDSDFWAYSFDNGTVTHIDFTDAANITQIAFRDDGDFFMYVVPGTDDWQFRKADHYSNDLVGNSSVLTSGTGTPPSFAIAGDMARIVLRFIKANGNSELDDLSSTGTLTPIAGLTDLLGTVIIVGDPADNIVAFKTTDGAGSNELHLLKSDNTVVDVVDSVGTDGQFNFGPLGDGLYSLQGTLDSKQLFKYSLDLATKTLLTPTADNYRSFVINPSGIKAAVSIKLSDTVSFYATNGSGAVDAPITIGRHTAYASIVFTNWTGDTP